MEARFEPIVRKYLDGKSRVLDAACGFNNSLLARMKFRSDESVGVDINEEVRHSNALHKNFLICDMHALRSEARFEAVISLFTWEHLHSPDVVLRNFFSSLEEGGIAIIVGPQRGYYVSVIARLLPEALRNAAWRLIKQKTKMPFPAYFRLCTRKSLAAEAGKIGFKIEYFQALDCPPIWFAGFPPLFVILTHWMQIANTCEIFSNLRSNFIMILKKP